MGEATFSVLVVDDNRSSAMALAKLLEQSGYDAEAMFDGASAIEFLGENRVNVVLTDLKMEPVGGLEVLEFARSLNPPVAVVVFSAHGEVNVAVEAMRRGAADFLTKPVTVEQLAIRLKALCGEGLESGGALLGGFIAETPSSQRLYKVLQALAEVRSPVWFEGEVGVGRTHCARVLHQLSEDEGPLQVWDPLDMHEWPEEGAILFPSVDEWDRKHQRALVRSLVKLPEGVRLMATARPDSLKRVSKGAFLSELYYRLAGMRVEIPPLRDRPDDIVPLFKRHLEHRAVLYGRPVPDITEEQLEPLRDYDWPGNLREMVNMVERFLVLGFDASHLSSLTAKAHPEIVLGHGFSLAQHLEEVERMLLERALEQTNGDRKEVGRLLGVERNSLRYKLKKYGLL